MSLTLQTGGCLAGLAWLLLHVLAALTHPSSPRTLPHTHTPPCSTRLEEVNVELTRLLVEEEKLAGVPLLVFANKQDLLSALPASDLSVGLNLTAIKDRAWQIAPCSAKSGEGLAEGMQWLIKVVSDKQLAAGGGSAASGGGGSGK